MNNKRPFIFFLISNLKRFYFKFSGKFFEKINKLIRLFLSAVSLLRCS